MEYRLVKQNGGKYEGWMICPVCRGQGHGMLVLVPSTNVNETERWEYQSCTKCGGDRIIAIPS